jgi:hypothetical protein
MVHVPVPSEKSGSDTMNVSTFNIKQTAPLGQDHCTHFKDCVTVHFDVGFYSTQSLKDCISHKDYL